MTYHILNGDALAGSFPHKEVAGEVIIMREALMDGDVSGDSLSAFWQARAGYMKIPVDEYYKTVVTEIEKLRTAPEGSTFYLWFEYDLFCQVNMWFIMSILDSLFTNKKVWVVYPALADRNDKNFWNGFGPATEEQNVIAFHQAVLCSDADLSLGSDLWAAYKETDLGQLRILAQKQSPAFPYLREVIEAHIDRFPANGRKGRPERVLEDITRHITTDFYKAFAEFWKRESIYGFGDTQLKKIYDKVMQEG